MINSADKVFGAGFGNSRASMGQPEPTTQQIPSENVVGGQSNFKIVKHSIPSIKSVHVTCDNAQVVLRAQRKIYFKSINALTKPASKNKNKNKILSESKISVLGSKMNTLSQIEVQQLECHPLMAEVVASVSGNRINVWNLEEPGVCTENFSYHNQITSIGWQ